MSFRASDYCVSVVALEKNNNKYGMTCAWFMQVDYDKILCLLGAQSTTGQIIEKNDLVGVSILSKNQKDIALALGENHSNEVDKFMNINIHNEANALLIPNASRHMICKVIDVVHLPEIEEDNLLYLRVLKTAENNEDFLHYSDL